MSSSWKILRSDVVIADLALSDLDMEALQSEGVAPNVIEWKSPSDNRIPAKGVCEEWAFKVLAYTDLGVNVSGTLTAQVIERAPATWIGENTTVYQYSGFAPNALLPTGRVFTIPGSTFHEFTVRCSSFAGVGATKLRVLYRPIR